MMYRLGEAKVLLQPSEDVRRRHLHLNTRILHLEPLEHKKFSRKLIGPGSEGFQDARITFRSSDYYAR